MWADLKPVVILLTIVVIVGTLLAAPLLRLLGWADTRTSFKDALNVQLAAAPLLGAYIWRIQNYDKYRNLFVGLISNTNARHFTTLGVILSVIMLLGYRLLARQSPLRTVGTTLVVIFGYTCATVATVTLL